MQALITALPQPYHQRIINIWDGLHSKFNITQARDITPIPHLTWHISHSYRTGMMEHLRLLLGGCKLPSIKVNGLGVFPGTSPVIYLSIDTSDHLVAFHQFIIKSILPFSQESVDLYEPDRWVPHITLALGDTTPTIAEEIIADNVGTQYDWRFEPDNFVLISENLSGTYIAQASIRV
ncbi:MAG: 2'-5' RNA ligase family protein [Anaerolineae bacterium]|nr:2'-5' RNA ligase family protein [Anaerolineae bacterium]